MKVFAWVMSIILALSLPLCACTSDDDAKNGVSTEDVFSTESSVAEEETSEEDSPATDDGIIDTVEEAEKDLVPTIAETFIDTALPNEEVPTFLEKLEKLQSFTVLSVKTEENGLIETVLSVSAPDLAWVMEKVEKAEAATEDEMNAVLEKAVAEAPLRSEEVNVTFAKEDDKWHPIMTDEFFNACYGGIIDLREDMLGGENDA